MAEVVYYVACSVDGFIATPDGGLRWLAPFESSTQDYGYASFYSGVDVLLMGSRTYQQALSFEPWPYPDKPVYVFSSGAPEPAGDNVIVVRDDPTAVVRTLVSEGHARLWLVGGGSLAGSFEAAGLIDSYVVSIIPVLLGDGIPLLGDRGVEATLRLDDIVRFPDGVVQHTYRVAG